MAILDNQTAPGILDILSRPEVGLALARAARGFTSAPGTALPLAAGLGAAGETLAAKRLEEQQAKQKFSRDLALRLAAKTAKEEPAKLYDPSRYKRVGNALLDLQTGQWITPPREAMSSVDPATAQYTEGDLLRGKDGRWYYSMFDRRQGKVVLQPLPEGFRPKDTSLTRAMGKADEKFFVDLSQQAEAAQQALPTYDEVLRILESNPNIYFGPGAETVQWLRRLAVAAGASPEEVKNVADADYLRSKFLEEAMRLIEKTKGAISDREMAMFVDAAPSLVKPRESNVKLIQFAKAVAERAIERERFIRKYSEQLGSSEAARELWDQYIKEHPLLPQYFSEEELKQAHQGLRLMNQPQDLIRQDLLRLQKDAGHTGDIIGEARDLLRKADEIVGLK